MNKSNTQNEIWQTLSMKQKGWASRLKYLFAALIIIVMAAIGVLLWIKPAKSTLPVFKTDEVKRGNLIIRITATGTLEPVNQVQVGTEISGTIKTVEVDFNDHVTAGQTLARLDTARLEAQVLQSEAALAAAKANLLDAKATLLKTDTEWKRLKKTWDLSGGKVPSRHELDAAQAAVKSAEAKESIAIAQIDKETASLSAIKTDLTKTVICSPVNGIVLERNVEPGQTVAASLQTPVLFTLAEDLSQMELHVLVDEADIGQVKEGQTAIFTVDAYPDSEFGATITQVRYSPKSENGVVTYETLLAVDNSSLLLRPGMTATADITVKILENVILVPNAALRFTPPKQSDKQKSAGFLSRLMPGPRFSGSKQKDKSGQKGKSVIWTIENEQPKPLPVIAGLTDGTLTELKGDGIAPGLKVLVDIVEKVK